MNDKTQPAQMTPQQRQAIAKAKARLRLQQQGQPQPAAPVQQPPARMDEQTSRSVLAANGIDPSAVKDWYNGVENRDGPSAQIPSWQNRPMPVDPLAPKGPPKPTPPPPALWEAPVNVAKALVSPDEARARALVEPRIDGVGPRTPDPTRAPISEQQLNSQNYWNAEKPPEPMTNPIKRAAIGVTNILSDTGNMIMEGAEAIQAPRTYDPKDPMSRRLQGAPPPPVKPGPRIPMIYKPEAQNVEQAVADGIGIIGGLALPLGSVSNTFRAGGQALRSVGPIGRVAAAITPQGTSKLAQATRVSGRVAAMTPGAAATAFGAGLVLGGEGMGGDGDRLKSGVDFASMPENYLFQPAAMLLNRAAIFIKTAGQRVTPEVVQVQRAQEVLRRANASAAEQAAAARVIDELTPPNPQAGSPQATAAPTAQAAAQPSVAPVVQPTVPQGAPRAAQAGPAGAGQQARPAAGGAGGAIPPNGGPPTLQATPRNVAPNVSREEIAIARDTSKAVSRFMRGARIPGNVVDDYVGSLLSRYEPLKSERYPLAFFIEEDLPQYLQSRGYTPAQARNLAGDVAIKTDGWGRAAHSFNESGNSSRYTMQDTIHQLTTTQKAELEGTFKAVLGDETLAGKSDEIKALMRQNGQEAYTNSISEANRVWRSKTATPEQSGAVAEMVMLMKTPAYRDLVPESWAIEATTTGRTLDDVIDAKIADDPIGTAHWLQSEIGDVARGAKNIDGTPNKASNAYETRRKALLDRLEKFPGYKGARAQHGDLYGADDSVTFGDRFLSVAKSELATENMARDLAKLSPRQQEVAALSIRDALLNPLLRTSPEDAAARITQLQNEGTLKALVTVLGPERGNELRNAIANMRIENQRIARVNQGAGSPTHGNQQGAKDAIDNIRGPGNRIANVAGNPTGWGIAAGLSIATQSPIPLALKAAGSVFDVMTTPGRQFQSRVTKGLYGLREADEAAAALPAPDAPPAIEPPSPPVSGPPSAKVKGPPKPRATKPPPTPEEWMQRIETDRNELQRLLRQYDQIDRSNPDVDDLMRANLDKQRNARRRIAEKTKKLEAARSGASPIAAPTIPATPAPPKGPPRPLPGQTSSSPPMIGGAALGALTSGGATYAATGDEEAALKAGILGGIGGGVVGSRFGKGAKVKPPAVKPKPAFDQRFMKEAQRLVSYNGGVDKALKAQQYVIDQLKNSKAPNAQDRLNRAVSIQYAIRRMAERSNRELDEIAATAPRSSPPGVKPPPVKNGVPMSAVGAGGGAAAGGIINPYDANGDGVIDDADRGLNAVSGAISGGVAGRLMRGGKAPPASAGKFRGPSQQTFAGVNAKTADKVALARAQNMEAEGASRNDIWDETGWFKGVDGKWRFEIDDSRSTFNEIGNGRDYLTHPDGMFKAYRDVPGMQDLDDVSLFRAGRKDTGAFMGAGSKIESIHIGQGSSDPRSIALHEYQHGIQARENFARGGMPETALEDRLKEINNELTRLSRGMDNRRSYKYDTGIDTKAVEAEIADMKRQYNDLLDMRSQEMSRENQYAAYRKLAGETEARNVQTRRDFTPEQRRARRPWETQDVPDDQQIVRFGSGKAESRPTPPKGQKAPPKGPSFPPRLAADLNKSKVSPATRATLDQNAALPPGERKSVMEATGWSDDILRIAAPYIRPGTRMESEVGNRIARLVQQANANPVEYALRQTMAKGAYEEAQKRFKQASGARGRAERNLEKLRSRNMLNPNQPATQQQLTVHKQRRDDAEQFLSEAARLRDEAKVMLDRADVELMSLPQVRDFANKEIQRITDALGVGGKASPGTAQLPSYNPMVKGPKPIPKPGAVNRPSKQAADELAHLLFEQDMAEKFAKIQSGEITPTQRNTFQQVMSWYARHPSLAVVSAVAAGGSVVGYAALATDQGERAVQARENARKRSGQPEPELPGPPAWDWEKLSRNRRFVEDAQAGLQALGYKIGRVDGSMRRADGKPTETEKAMRHFLWTLDNTRDPEAPPTEAEHEAFKEAVLQARRKR